MKIANRKTDIEVTNRCNATCNFCPREATPKQGFMSDDSFHQIIKRLLEIDKPENIDLSLTGRGEPTLHPKIVEYTQILTDKGFDVAITSNGSRFTPEMSENLLQAGLKRIHLSVSDLNEDYNKIYGLKFDDVMSRIDNFLEIAKDRCYVQVTVVRHQNNQDTVEDTINYWESKDEVDLVHVVREENRAGLIQSEFSYEDKRHLQQNAIKLLHDKGLTDICSLPFFSVFFGWEGNYNLCCQDWEKTVFLGNVFDFSIEEIDAKKLEFVEKHYGVCEHCSLNPINEVQELLGDIEAGKRGKFAIANKLGNLNTGRQFLKPMRDILDDMGYQSKIIARSNQ